MNVREVFTWNNITQVCLPFFTILGFILTGLKIPEWGLVSNLFAQIFWLPSTYRAWKEANQIGLFINTVIISMILVAGVVNYWLLS